MKYRLKDYKNFAMENWNKYINDEKDAIASEFDKNNEFSICNPWIDRSARFELTDEDAVKTWGLEAIIDFCEQAREVMEKKERC